MFSKSPTLVSCQTKVHIKLARSLFVVRKSFDHFHVRRLWSSTRLQVYNTGHAPTGLSVCPPPAFLPNSYHVSFSPDLTLIELAGHVRGSRYIVRLAAPELRFRSSNICSLLFPSRSAYSLCGDVVLSLRPQWSLLGRQPGGSVRIAVSSIALTFEGQCEVVSPRHGYSATRLCSIIKELVPSPAPIELETELGTQECGADFNAAFSLPVPGWLPATTQLGYNSDFGVKYTLFVDVSYYTLSEEGASASSGLSFLRFCSPFFTRTRFAAAETGVVLRRFMTEATPRLRTFNIPPVIPAVADVSTSALDDLASKIQVFATLPECVSTQASSFPCSLRISAKQLDMADREKLKITMLNMNVFQVEKCRYAPLLSNLPHAFNTKLTTYHQIRTINRLPDALPPPTRSTPAPLPASSPPT